MSTDGGYRSSSSKNLWDWTSSHLQSFEHSEGNNNVYPQLLDKWALLIAASTGWGNYRFQADDFAMYQILKKHGYDDKHIILICEDDLAYKEIIPLGDNGEYLEMSSTRVPNISIREIYGTNRKSKKQDTPKQSEVTNNTNHPMDDTNRGLVTQTPAQEKSKAEKVIQGIMNSELGMRTPELAKKYLTANTIINADGQVEISNPTVWKYLSAAMESQGLTADKNELKDVLDKLC